MAACVCYDYAELDYPELDYAELDCSLNDVDECVSAANRRGTRMARGQKIPVKRVDFKR